MGLTIAAGHARRLIGRFFIELFIDIGLAFNGRRQGVGFAISHVLGRLYFRITNDAGLGLVVGSPVAISGLFVGFGARNRIFRWRGCVWLGLIV